MRQLSDAEQAELDAVEQAISVSSPETIELVRLIFWQQSHTLHGAALRQHMSYNSARRRVHRFLIRVAKYRGLM